METMPITEAKDRLAELVIQVESQRDRITITRNGKPAAILVSAGEWESINETLEVLADPQALRDIQESADAYVRGETYDSTEIAAILRARTDGSDSIA